MLTHPISAWRTGVRTHAGRTVCVHAAKERAYRRADSLVVHKRCSHEYWRGYVGIWHVDLHDPSISRTMHGLRTLKWRDAQRQVLDQINLFDAEKPGAKPRDLDGLYQQHLFYDHSNAAQDLEEVRVAGDDDPQAHLLAVNGDAYGQVMYSLPAVARPGNPGQQSCKEAAGNNKWGAELFLWDGEDRWSCIVMYDRATGDLVKVTLAQEHYSDIKPSTPNVLKVALPKVKEPREPLDSEPFNWLQPRTAGKAHSLHRQHDGGLLLMHEGAEEVHWSVPDTEAHPVNALILLPDSMYLFAPVSLELLKEEDRQGCRIEFGGLMHQKQGSSKPSFQRILLDYELSTGRISQLSHERY